MPVFYIDTLNGHVRLPKIIRFISSISQLSELGTVYNDQIKSHTHGLPGANSACAGGGRLLYVYGASDSPAQANYRKSSVSGSNEGYPKHVRLPLYIQVVNNTAEISRFDVDALKKSWKKRWLICRMLITDISRGWKMLLRKPRLTWPRRQNSTNTQMSMYRSPLLFKMQLMMNIRIRRILFCRK